MTEAKTVAPEPSLDLGQAIKSRVTDVGFWADWAAVIGFIVLAIFFSIANENFLTSGNIQAVLIAAAILTVITVGQTFVITTGGIDLSVASTMTLGAVIFGAAFTGGFQATPSPDGGLGLGVSIILAVLAAGAVGVVNGVLIAKGKITDFIVTLGTLSAASGLALVLSDGKPVTIINSTLLKFSTDGIGSRDTFLLGWSVVIAIVVALLAHFILFHTRFGTHVFATGGSPDAARATGINIARIKIAVYTISGSLAGVAAIMLVARVGAAQPASNTAFLLSSVAAVVLGGVSLVGGKGNIIGPVVGALLLTALTNGLTLMAVSQFYQPLAVGIVVVLAALLTRFQR